MVQVSADRGTVLDAAEEALVDAGFRIAMRDEVAGLLRTHPVMLSSREYTDMRRPLGSRGRLRRVAEVRVADDGRAARTWCRTVIEELATEAYRLGTVDNRSTDSPSDTPIEREAGTTREQNAVWKIIRRDRRTEQQILQFISDRTASPASPAGEES